MRHIGVLVERLRWISFVLFVLIFHGSIVRAQIFGYTPDVDYPIYVAVPDNLTFNCRDKLPGYYADVETRCQVWHWCLHNGVQFSFLCPNGTVFNQAVRVCDWWDHVDCPAAIELYVNNEQLYVVGG